MRAATIAAVACLLLAGCSDGDSARRALEGAGYTHVETTGFRYFGCGDDNFRTGFRARGANGQPVSGVVCAGFLKGSTIRLD